MRLNPTIKFIEFKTKYSCVPPDGIYVFYSKMILIDKRLTDFQKVYTLFHELGHYVIHTFLPRFWQAKVHLCWDLLDNVLTNNNRACARTRYIIKYGRLHQAFFLNKEAFYRGLHASE